MSIVYLVVVARSLGARDYGVLVLVAGYTQFVGSIVTFSGFHGVVRYGAMAIEAGDRARLARIVRFMTLVEIGCGAAAILIAAATAPLVGARLGWTADAMRLAVPYALAVIGTVRATPQGLLQIAGRFDRIGLHQLVSPTVKLVGSLMAWRLGGGLHAFLLVWLAASLAEGLSMWVIAWPVWTRMTEGAPLRGDWRGVARHDGFGRFIVTANFDISLRELAPNLAPLTIGWMLGPAAAGLFSLAQRTTATLAQPATLLGQASYSVLARLAATGATDELRATVLRTAAIAGGIALPIVALFAGYGKTLMPLIGGRSFAAGGALVTLVASARAMQLVATPLTAGLTATGLPQRSMAVTLAANLALYPLLPAMIMWLGVDGAGWHALGQAGVTLVALFALFERASNGKPRAARSIGRT